MAGKRTIRKARGRGKKAPSDLLGAGLLASAFGNILQAADRAGLKRERAYLLRVVDDWQAAFARLQADAESTRRELRAARERIAILEDQVGELRRRLKDAVSQARKAEKELLGLETGPDPRRKK